MRWPFAIRRAVARRPIQTAIVLAVGIFELDLVRLGAPSLWLDETFSVGLAEQPYHVMAHYLWGIEPNMELYYLVLHFWLGLAGSVPFLSLEVLARLPSALAAAAAGGVLFALGYRFWGWTAGLVSVIVYALSDFQLMYAQQARGYSMEVLFGVCAWFGFLALVNGFAHRRVWWTVFGLATVLGIYTHLFTVFVLISQLAAFALLFVLPNPWRAQVRSLLLPMVVCLLLIAHLCLPMLLVARGGAHTSWFQPATLGDLYAVFLVNVSGGSVVYLAVLAALLFGLVLTTSLAAFRPTRHLFQPVSLPSPTSREGPSGDGAATNDSVTSGRVAGGRLPALPWWAVLTMCCWLVVPLAISFLLTQPDLNLLARYEIVILPPISLLAGIAVALIPWRYAQIAIALVVLALAASTVPSYYPQAEIQDFRSAAGWVETHYQSGDGVACFPLYDCAKPMNVYFADYAGPAHMDANSPGGNSWQTATDQPVTVATVSAYAQTHTRLFLVWAPIASSAQVLATGQAIRGYLNRTYTLIGTYRSRGVTVYFYDTTTVPPSAA
jgi:uncharacterized membrane protein